MSLSDDEKNAIADAQAQSFLTKRRTVTALEEVLYQPFFVLDHGLVRVIDYMGDDGAIVQAARVSYGRGTTKVSDDRGLIRYLVRHRHTTPLEMCELKLHIKLPIFVARQWIRHRMASVNEYSARYSILDREFYVPPKEDLGIQSKSNRQGRADPLPEERAEQVLTLLREDAMRCYDHYLFMLDEPDEGDKGPLPLARELARINLTLNYYTQWYWKIDLHNLFHFLLLRMDRHAQKEIRVYAEVIGQIVSRWVPSAWEAFVDYRKDGVEFSRQELLFLRALVRGEHPQVQEFGLSLREQAELKEKLGLP